MVPVNEAPPPWLNEVRWNEQGLVPVVAQEQSSGQILTLAWMNAEALQCTVAEGRAVYWSRSRKRLWRKGEQSGNVQKVLAVRLDCDADTLLLEVEQVGGIACHTGRRHCFFHELRGERWEITEPVLRDPADMYGPGS